MSPGLTLERFVDDTRLYRDGLLMIGFDGTAALLGHGNRFALISRLCGNQYEGEFQSRLTETVGRNDSPLQWVELLREWTAAPPTGADLDAAAIEAIAGLVRVRKISTIVATDPNDELYYRLRSTGLALTSVHVASMAHRHLMLYANRSVEAPIFVDAGGLLLAGYLNGARNSDAEPDEKTHLFQNWEAFLSIIGRHRNTFCWGWSGVNIPYAYFDRDRNDRSRVFVLGTYTKIDELIRSDVAQVFDSAEEKQATGVATTELLKHWARALKVPLDGGQGLLRIGPSTAAPVPDAWAQPLLRKEVLDGLLVDNDDGSRRVMIVGVDAPTVRQSVANWMRAKLAERGTCVLRESASFVELASTVTLETRRRRQQHIIACYLGPAGEPESVWQDSVMTFVNQWLNLPSNYPEHRITLLCPPAICKWLIDNGIDSAGISPETYDADTYLTEENLSEWIDRAAGQFLPERPGDAIKALTDRIIALAESHGADGPSVAAYRAEMWRRLVVDSLLESNGSGRNGSGPVDVVAEWDDLAEALRTAGARLDVAFDIVPRPVDDFEIGTPRLVQAGSDVPDADDVAATPGTNAWEWNTPENEHPQGSGDPEADSSDGGA